MFEVALARMQFALTIGFHFLFPPITIGLIWFILVIETLGWRRNDRSYTALGVFFGKIFTITFAVGVVSGIVMSLQFGTNWGEFTKYSNALFSSILLIEIFFAFFIESTFLGIYLFGRHKVPRWLHWFSIVMLALGATLSAFWIIAANSWMHSPAGYALSNGKVVLTDLGAAIFNKTTFPRFFHTIVSCLVIGAFFVSGISAYLIATKKAIVYAKKTLLMGLTAGPVLSVVQVIPFGHMQVLAVAETQPANLATMEGLYETQSNAPLLVFGIPIEQPPYITNRIEIPGLLSVMLSGNRDHVVAGMRSFPEEDRPPHAITFLSFHAMVAIGIAMIVIMASSLILHVTGKLSVMKPLLYLLAFLSPLPIVATQLGWITTEVGRQPWIIYGLLRTKDAVSISVSANALIFSLVLIGALYIIIISLYLFLFVRILRKGPPVDKALDVGG